jgi:endonuclease/exonuclease/phosphatase family metal-dependent hydrolase
MAKKKKTASILIGTLFFVNLLLILLLATALISPYVSPEKGWFFAFAGLLYPYLLLGNMLFVLLWLFVRWKRSLWSLLVILAGWSHMATTYQISGKSKAYDSPEDHIAVMSFNVRNFDLYNYKKDWTPNVEKRNRIFDFLMSHPCDILCFQEYVQDSSGEFKTTDTLKQLLKTYNRHNEYTVNSRNKIYFGIATYTRYPIAGKGRINFSNSKANLCIYTDIVVKEDTIRIYNAHFESVHLSRTDQDFAEDISDLNTDRKGSEIRERSRMLASRLKRAFIRRCTQADTVAAHIANCPYPVVVCTDLNDTPVSYAYRTLSKGLKDAFRESGSGLGKTYEAIAPSFRIDYIFHSKDFSSYNFSIHRGDLSDHYPISCDLEMRKN